MPSHHRLGHGCPSSYGSTYQWSILRVWAQSYPFLSSYKAHEGATTTIMSPIVRVVRPRGGSDGAIALFWHAGCANDWVCLVKGTGNRVLFEFALKLKHYSGQETYGKVNE